MTRTNKNRKDTQRESGVSLTSIQQNRITLYFDISHFSSTSTGAGIRRVVGKFIQFLPSSLASNNVEVVYITGREEKSVYHALEQTRDGRWNVLGPIHPVKEDWYVCIDLCPGDMLRHTQEISEWKKKGVVCFFFIHDIIFAKFPEYIETPKKVVALNKWLRFVTETADCLLTSSVAVKKDIEAWAKDHELDIENTHFITQHLGSDFHRLSNKQLIKSEEYQFLCVSTIEPRKGYDLLIPAFIHILEKGIQARLVIVGRRGWKCDNLVRLLLDNPYAGTRLIWKDRCDDAELNRLYSESDCFVFASREEGFGLGVIEAAQSGLPLLLRDIPIFREIAGSCAIYFNEDTLERKLISIVRNPNTLPSSAQINMLTWEDSIRGMVRQILDWIRSEHPSDCKSVDGKCNLPSILECLPPYCASSSTLLKLMILSKFHPTKKGRQHYSERIMRNSFYRLGRDIKSCLRYLTCRLLSVCALTREQRGHFHREMIQLLTDARKMNGLDF